ncbi:uncharacterized protein LOC114322601 [Camellia sinensis]|uniref:uncharacterized protein LOC114322601 n=1 Tax=Camellia sinensis TaxID=4442 RepID=UPI001035F0F6|nr:uncharacterized protein LOC114322601 [Camellia sinensis]
MAKHSKKIRREISQPNWPNLPSGFVEAWDFNCSVPRKIVDIEAYFPKEKVEFEKSLSDLYSSQFYWVESLGEHLLVIRYIGEFVRYDSEAVHEADFDDGLHGYFKGARGLRQGDPMSLYLFVLAMEILAKILAEKAMNPLFKFHWKCDKTKIINLCFADDLMIFSRGDASIVKLIMECLKEFSSLSGLIPNPSKSNIYFSGCDMELRAAILEIAKFNEGTLPVRITNRVKSWTNRALSYAGRSQLIQSILFSMQVYWSSLFILPKKVIREIDSILRAFLWSGTDLKTHSAKIAWDFVCAPKNEGGLGFKSLDIWNRAAIAKHIWFLFSGGEGSMWCQWVKSYLLKGKSFWIVKVPNDPSWVWRKLLSLRKWVSPLIKHKIGCGDTTFLWFDNWHPIGPLWNKFGDRIIYDSALNSDTKVSKIIDGSSWKWPFPNSWEIQELISSTPVCFHPNPSSTDQAIWNLTIDESLKSASLFGWLSTIDFPLVIDSSAIEVACNIKWPVLGWPDSVTFASKETKGNSLRVNIISNAFLCSVYMIWIERNNRIFNKELKPEEVVIKSVIHMVRDRMLSLKNIPRSNGDKWYIRVSQVDLSILEGRVMKVKEANFEWCEPLNCGPSDESSYIECAAAMFCLWYHWMYSLLISSTGSITMFELYGGCLDRDTCYVSEGCGCYDIPMLGRLGCCGSTIMF